MNKVRFNQGQVRSMLRNGVFRHRILQIVMVLAMLMSLSAPAAAQTRARHIANGVEYLHRNLSSLFQRNTAAGTARRGAHIQTQPRSLTVNARHGELPDQPIPSRETAGPATEVTAHGPPVPPSATPAGRGRLSNAELAAGAAVVGLVAHSDTANTLAETPRHALQTAETVVDVAGRTTVGVAEVLGTTTADVVGHTADIPGEVSHGIFQSPVLSVIGFVVFLGLAFVVSLRISAGWPLRLLRWVTFGLTGRATPSGSVVQNPPPPHP